MKDEATRKQIEAANPRGSTWVSANAGSGKTRVLTDRVARLLLDRVDPRNILCLTYTKAAASEMQNRLFRRLGEWAMMPDDRLQRELEDMGAGTGFDLQHARTLFASAIETPGGLRIQTIHSFCSAILRRFPLEAGVSPQFTEIEDRAAELLRAEVLDTMAEGPDSHLIDSVAGMVNDQQLLRLCAEIIGNKHDFQPRRTRADLAAGLGVDASLTRRSLLADVFQPSDRKTLTEVRTLCAGGSANDVKAALKLHALSTVDFTMGDLALLEDVCLTGAGAKEPFSAKIGSFPTKKTQEKNLALIDDLNDLMERVQEARPRRLACDALDRSELLHNFAAVFIDLYEGRKLRSGLLDFDDLIDKARQLLTDPVVASWVLFKLDGGIDHILVDEAQDTSPTQWAVVDALAREFTAGEGARAGETRTIFVVGDKKQSIYSFQGADPDEFDRMRDFFGDALRGTETPLHVTELQYSFRSSPAILSLVDQTFTGPLSEGLEATVRHHAFKSAMPGRVDLWPMIPKSDKPEEREWFDPLDMVTAEQAEVVLARRIAAQIKQMMETETIPAEVGHSGTFERRKVRAGDFLILVQRRSLIFDEVIRACKALDLPIAGADRLPLNSQLAVQDIVSLLKFLALAEDDLSLAEALRSPLFGWTEQDLFTIAHARKGYLWETLRKAREAHPETLAILDDLRNQADYLRPYDLIERILTRHGGRKKLVFQLGGEAEDAIDALLAQALSYERSAVPGLTGFLHWLEGDDVTVKRQIDSASDQIRVMTVHGSKGLEAPIVIMPETQTRRNDIKDAILKTDVGPMWKPRSEDTPDALRDVMDGMKAAASEERRRLLYVAMTRAEKWLIVCGAGEAKEGTESWHEVIGNAMETAGAVDLPLGDETGLRFQHGDWDGLPLRAETAKVIETVTTPVFADLADIPERVKALSPSDLGGAKALPGEIVDEDEDAAKARGRMVHMLLEHLPTYADSDRHRVGSALIAADPDAGLVPERDRYLADVIALLGHPDLMHLFGPETLAEVELTATIPELGNQRIHGTIDRLVIEDDRIFCLDFKSNRVVPDRAEAVPEGILRQMGAYYSALHQIYPGRRIETAILWTATGTVMPLPDDIVMAALRRAGSA